MSAVMERPPAPCPPGIRERLRQQREAAAHRSWHQDWLGDWWKGLIVDQRRTLLALSGLDDSPEFARRPWAQMTTAQRDQLLVECKKIARLVGSIEWA